MASIRQVGTLATTASGTAIAPAWPAATLDGSYLVAVIFSRNEGATPAWNDPPAGWDLAVADSGGTDRPHTRIYVFEAAGVRSGTESFSHGGSAEAMAGQLLEVEPGAGETLTLDEVASLFTAAGGTNARDTGTTPTTGGATIQVGGAVVRNASRTLASIKDSFTERANGVAGSGFTGLRCATGSKSEAGAEAASTGWTVNNTSGSQGTGAIVTILVTAGGGGTPQHLAATISQPQQVDAALRVGKELAATISQPVDLEGSLRAGTMRATISQPVTVTAALRLGKHLAATISQPHTIVAALRARKTLAATISQSQTVTAAVRVRKQLAATISQEQIMQARLTVGVVVAIRRLRTLLRVGT